MTAAFVFPGQGSQAVGMGKALAEAFPPARAVFDEVDAALGEKLTAIMWEGPADKLTLTENAQPALMAVSVAVDAGAGGGGRRRSRARREVRRRPFARRIFGAGRGRRLHGDRRGEASAHPRQRHAEGGAGRHRRDGGAARAGARCGESGRGRGGAGRGLPGRQRQRRRAGRGVRQQGGGRARGRDRQGQGRAARDDAAGVRAVPLRADAARGRRDGRGARQDRCEAAGRCRWWRTCWRSRSAIRRRS